MKKLLLTVILFCTFCYASMGQTQKTQTTEVLISTGTLNTDLIYRVNPKDGRLYQAYIGSKLNSPEMLKLRNDGHQAYPTFGTGNLFEPAIRMTHNDGNPSLELKYISHNSEKPDANVTITNILLKDPEYPVEVTLHIKTYSAEDVIEQWVEIVQ